jgi:nucleotide-binding universal stress UspA family protein
MGNKIRILVGYDGSTSADSALNDLQRAGLPREAEAVVLTVSEVWLAPPSRTGVVGSEGSTSTAFGVKQTIEVDRPLESLEAAESLARSATTRLKEYFTAWRIRTEVSVGSPAREILKVAENCRSDLIVLGCHGHSVLGRFLLGTVSQKVANEACCSVRVVRGTAWKRGSPVRIVIGLDGSPGSQAAVNAVAARAWPMGSKVRLITVDGPPGVVAYSAPRISKANGFENRQNSPWVHQFLEAATKNLRAAELVVSSQIEVGDPKHTLVTDAEEWGADCIFLGSGSGNHLKTAMLGSVSTAVLTRAHCSVDIVRSQ